MATKNCFTMDEIIRCSKIADEKHLLLHISTAVIKYAENRYNLNMNEVYPKKLPKNERKKWNVFMLYACLMAKSISYYYYSEEPYSTDDILKMFNNEVRANILVDIIDNNREYANRLLYIINKCIIKDDIKKLFCSLVIEIIPDFLVGELIKKLDFEQERIGEKAA